MACVVLSSGLFGDRTVKVAMSNRVGVAMRTGTGTGRAVTLTKQNSGEYSVKFNGGFRGQDIKTFDRKTALQKAAEFIVKYEPAGTSHDHHKERNI
jgi:hypothetical protein